MAQARLPQACPECHGTGYLGRTLLVEMLTLDLTEVPAAILARADRVAIEHAALRGGMHSRWYWANQAVESGLTSAAEVRRVLGFSDALEPDAG